MSANAEHRLLREAENAELDRLRQRVREQEGRADFGAFVLIVSLGAVVALQVGADWRATATYAAGMASLCGLRTWIVAKVRAERLRDLAE